MALKLEQLVAFKYVVENQGFTSAAVKLNLSKVAVSKQIAQLERQLQTKLIQRTTRQFALTAPGLELYKQALTLLEQVDQIEKSFADQQQAPQGHLRIMATPYFASIYLLPRLAEFLQRYPQIKLELLLAERFPHLAQEQIDVFVGASLPGYDSLVRKKVGETRYVFCASPAYLQRYGIPMQPNDLKQHRYLNHSMRIPNDTVHFAHAASISVTPYLIINDTAALLTCARAHMGIVKLHEYLVHTDLKDGILQEVLPKYSEKNVPVYLFYTQQSYVPLKIKAFVEFLDFQD